MSRLDVELWGGPHDGRLVRVYEVTEEVHVPLLYAEGCARYLRHDDGKFRYQDIVTKGEHG